MGLSDGSVQDPSMIASLYSIGSQDRQTAIVSDRRDLFSISISLGGAR